MKKPEMPYYIGGHQFYYPTSDKILESTRYLYDGNYADSNEEDEIEMKEDGKQIERFETTLRQVLSVPKDEILRREKEEKERNKQRKARKT